MSDTIFALSSGAPPAAIGVTRISGPNARSVLEALAGTVPEPRTAVLRSLRDAAQGDLDRALVLWFPGPASATGEDLAEFHCHGGRAVISAVERTLTDIDGVREAQPGEFTRRAFANGRIDLAQAEGLGDLLTAETELQRQAAIAAVGGALSRRVEGWRKRTLMLSATVEAVLDFADEDDGAHLPASFAREVTELASDLARELASPSVEPLREGIRVVLAGPPNAGKSSLFNALLDDGVAIVSAEAGTTRDVIERSVAFSGIAFVLVDTAGLRDSGAGPIERLGIGKAREELAKADLVLWLGPEGNGPPGALEIESHIDVGGFGKVAPDYRVSAITHQGVAELVAGLVERARQLIPLPGSLALNRRQRAALSDAHSSLSAGLPTDLLLVAEQLRAARSAFDRLLGRSSTEEMLDALFGRFCIGK